MLIFLKQRRMKGRNFEYSRDSVATCVVCAVKMHRCNMRFINRSGMFALARKRFQV